jgi:hypothetical protein
MRRRVLPVSRPYGWRYWTRRAAFGFLVTFTRGALVVFMVSVLLVLWGGAHDMAGRWS